MVSLIQSPHDDYPVNLCEMLLRNVAHILVTTRMIERTINELRPKCESTAELIGALDAIVALNEEGQVRLQNAIAESGAVLPILSESAASPVISWFLASIPDRVVTGVMAADIISNLRFLIQHLELKTKLAAEETALVGQISLGLALLEWSARWRSLGHNLRSVNVRLRAQAYIADVPSIRPPLAAAVA